MSCYVRIKNVEPHFEFRASKTPKLEPAQMVSFFLVEPEITQFSSASLYGASVEQIFGRGSVNGSNLLS